MKSFSDEEQIIFFNTTTIGYLTRCGGSFHKVDDGSIYISDDNDAIIRAQNKEHSLIHLGPEYENIYITYLPAKEKDYCPHHTNTSTILQNEYAKCPMIKISQDSGEFKCYLSGRRSAILIDEQNNGIRLKGCGNLFIGFNLAKVDDLGAKHFEIRGTQFKNTCFTEQWITSLVNKELEKRGLISGNYAIGFYKYGEIPSPLIDEAKYIDKYCGIFRTLGDKRLGCNFYNGLNYVLESMFGNKDYTAGLYSSIVNFEEISKILPAKNFSVNSNGEFTVEFNEWLLENPMLKTDWQGESRLFDFSAYLEQQKTLNSNLFSLEKGLLWAYVEDVLKKVNLPFNDLLMRKFSLMFEMLEALNMNFFTALIYLISKISYEIGLYKRVFEEFDLNWGTYEYHCNAHLDNYILAPPNKEKLILAPLDFDLAFTRDQFIRLKYDNLKGIENNLNFDELLEREKNNLMVQMIGFNMIPNIDVRVLEFDKINEMNKEYRMQNDNFLELIKESIVDHYSMGYLKTGMKDLFSTSEFYNLAIEIVQFVLLLETYCRVL